MMLTVNSSNFLIANLLVFSLGNSISKEADFARSKLIVCDETLECGPDHFLKILDDFLPRILDAAHRRIFRGMNIQGKN
jgi:hypothetical protein